MVNETNNNTGGFWGRMKDGLRRSRDRLIQSVDTLLDFQALDEALFEELEALLVQTDMGMLTTERVLERLKERSREQRISNRDELFEALAVILEAELCATEPNRTLTLTGDPSVMLLVGVNGVGKTTSAAKLAHRLKTSGYAPILGAVDTFRAAAIEQLQIWGERVDVDVIAHAPGADPAAVAFDTVKAAVARKNDVVLLDTAGRLHSRKNLMAELEKISRVVGRESPGAPQEVLLVLDATTGQNALRQAQVFGEVVAPTGIILTKLDGTAKGGITFAVEKETGVPVKFVGLGEGMEDLQPFEPAEFSAALLGIERPSH